MCSLSFPCLYYFPGQAWTGFFISGQYLRGGQGTNMQFRRYPPLRLGRIALVVFYNFRYVRF